MLVASCGGGEHSESTGKAGFELKQYTVTLQAPKGVPVLSPVLESADGLILGGQSTVNPTSPVVALGATGTRIEPDAMLNDLWSRGPTQLKDRVHVFGSVHSSNVTLGNNVVVSGTTDKTPVFDPTEKLSWTVTFPSTPTSNVDLVVNPPKSQNAKPGNYDFIRVGNGSILTLSSGTYYTNTLQLESGSQVLLDQDNGPVQIYVSTTIALRGAIAPISGGSPDIFIGYFGTNAMFVESAFDGAIVSPLAALTLRKTTPIQRGFFAGKSLELDAQATVGYRFPLPLIPAVKLDPTQCKSLIPLRSDLSGAAQEAAYVADLQRYCGECLGGRDTDKDGTADCIDECPYDPLKKKRGVCDCGNAETDKDNDKIPACIDRCDNDPKNAFVGDCGCVGSPGGVAPAGTKCFDPSCPNQPNATCNGAGVCGDRTACKVGADCASVAAAGNVYWLCGGSVPGGGTPVLKPWATASQACAAKGMVLARVDTYDRNQLIQGLLQSYGFGPSWLGGNSRAVAGAWRWAKTGSDSGDQFWSGGATGARVGGRFAAWSLSRPAAQRCLAIQPSDGRWIDNDCNAALPYVCEVPQSSTPGTITPPKPPIPAQGVPAMTCIGAGTGAAPLPGDLATLKAQYDGVDAGSFVGAAANPPAPNTTNCLVTPPGADNCTLTDPHDDDCVDDAQCVTLHGAGYFCRATKLDPSCVPVTTPGAEVPCATKLQCGKPDCAPDAFPNRCNQIEVCPDPNSVYTFKGPDTGSNLGPQDVDTTTFFPPTKPDQTASPSYADPANAGGTGRDHAWCKLNPQATTKVQPAATDVAKHGASGDGSPITFTFDPDLLFDADPGAAAFGEAALKVHALASLNTHVSLKNFLKQNYEADIIKVAIGLKAERCRVSTGETTIKILGKDFTQLTGFIPKLDTNDLAQSKGTKAAADLCNSSFSDFLLKAGRLKKAFRDAQQLILQYKNLKNGHFPADFCQQIGIDAFSSPDFPLGGLCPEGERPEDTINRFIDYYQGEAFGQLFNVDPAAMSLSSATDALKSGVASALGVGGDGSLIDVPFVDFKRSESNNILSAQFFIGPVPMTIEVDAVASYGVHGGFNLELNLPTQLRGGRGDLSNPDAPRPQNVAKVGAGVEPWASAGLTLFVGAGFSVPGVSASIGIEGAVSLARIGMPVGASAGVSLATVPDNRPLPDDIASAAAPLGQNPVYPFDQPNSYQFFLQYQYGASVTLQDVLSGVVSGRLRIKFFFFSRTWRKTIIQFNGWGPFTYPLINGGGQSRPLKIPNGSAINIASGLVGMGRSEAQLPFVLLSRLVAPPATPPDLNAQGGAGGTGGSGGSGAGTGGSGGSPVVNVDKSQVELFSYDDLCCSKLGQECPPAAQYACCPDLVCNAGVCEAKPPLACANYGAACGWDSTLHAEIACCSGDPCQKNGLCPAAPACLGDGQACTGESGPACCEGLSCNSGTCQMPCASEGHSCTAGCCPGLQCGDGFCYDPGSVH